jgi:transposase InsO family protein
MLRKEDYIMIKALKKRGVCQKDIAAEPGVHPKTIRMAWLSDSFVPSRKNAFWVQTLSSLREARYQAEEWIRWHNDARPYQALDFGSPAEYRQQRVLSVA